MSGPRPNYGATPRFVEILTAPSVVPNSGAYLYGRTADGIVYAWDGYAFGWMRLENPEPVAVPVPAPLAIVPDGIEPGGDPGAGPE